MVQINKESFGFQVITCFVALYLVSCLSGYLNLIVALTGKTLVLAAVSWSLVSRLRKRFVLQKLSSYGKAVLVTGCDSGFGHRLARRLNAAGYRVFAACLDADGAGAHELAAAAVFADRLHLHAMDVRSDADVARVRATVEAQLANSGDRLWATVCNAGVGMTGLAEWGRMEHFDNTFQINTLGVVRTARAFLPLIRQSRGRVIVTASQLSRMGIAGAAAYTMSKHGVLGFCECLRKEMAAWKVKVVTIEPTFYRTAMTTTEALSSAAEKTFRASDQAVQDAYGEAYLREVQGHCDVAFMRDNPEEVVDAMMDAIESPEPEVRYTVCNLTIWAAWFVAEHAPSVVADYVIQLFNKSNVEPAGLVPKKKDD